MGAHNRKLKYLMLGLGDSPDEFEFACQVETWTLNNNTEDGEKRYSFCYNAADPDPNDGEFREDAEPDWSLSLTLYADWRSNGISRYLTQHDGETVVFRLDHHPDIPAEHVTWDGSLKIKAPSVGGEPRTTEMTEVELVIIGKPVDSYEDDSI